MARKSQNLKLHARQMRREPTPAESILWKSLRHRIFKGLKFRRQQPLGPYIVDFCCPGAKLVVELDGGGHASDDARDYDRQRTEYLQTAGIQVLRFWNSEVMDNMDGVLQAIERALEIVQSTSGDR